MVDTIYKGFWNEVPAAGASPDLRAIVVRAAFSGTVQESAVKVSDFATLAELDGVGYLRADLAGVTITYDATITPDEVQADWTDDDDGWGATVAPGSTAVLGMLIVRFVDGAGNDVPWFYTDQGAVSPNGGKYGWQLPALGLVFWRKKV